MKNHLIISLLILSVGFCQQEYNINDINKRSGVSYKKFSDERVNGNVYQMFGDTKVDLGKLKDGKKDGLWKKWYDNGQKEEEGTYKDGELDGLYTYWYENGQKGFEEILQMGEMISRKDWNEDGSRKENNDDKN